MIVKWLKQTRLRWKVTRLLLPLLGVLLVLRWMTSSSIPQEILDFESKFLPNAGLKGKEHSIPSQTHEEIQAIIKTHAFNKAVSDQINVVRPLRDYRHTTCKSLSYEDKTPSLGPASVILIFNGEALSALIRTVWSVLKMSPDKLLHEIILLDDGSTSDELTKVLPLYVQHRLPSNVHLYRLPNQTGLIQARIAGAKFAKGKVLVFLDSHCEATQGWLPPLLAPIAENPSTVTIPTIDYISDQTLAYSGNAYSDAVSVGSFTWSGHFSWASYGGHRDSPAQPAPTPTMAGGLFAVEREFFWSIGGYDDAMIGWGGENLELSFRVWRCHGRMLSVPCSHVGHIFRSFHPYFIPNDSHGLNTMRMAEVWMDEYKRFFYLYRTDLRDKVPKAEELASRNSIKERLQCKSFEWYLTHVIPDKFRMEDEAIHWGRLRNRASPSTCADHLQRDGGHNRTPFIMGQYPCHSHLGSSQYLLLTKEGALRNEFSCGLIGPGSNAEDGRGVLRMVGCEAKRGSDPTWTYDKASGALMHEKSRRCLSLGGPKHGSDLVMRACDGGKEQAWDWEFNR